MITDKTENIFERLTIIFNVPVHFLLDSLLESIIIPSGLCLFSAGYCWY